MTLSTYDSAFARAMKARIEKIIEDRTAQLQLGRATSFDDYKGRCHEITNLSALLQIMEEIEDKLNDVGMEPNPVLATGRKR